MIKIKWLGHACFRISFDDINYVIDPFEDNYVPGYKNIDTSADEVFITHKHNDHAGLMNVRCTRRITQGVKTIKVKTFHDDKQGALRGENIVHIFEYDGKRIGHFGDIGHILTEQQIQEIGELDVAIIPVGDIYTVDAEKAKTISKQVCAKVTIPMHYRDNELGFKELDTVNKFKDMFQDIKYNDNDEYIVEDNPHYNIVILKYER